MGMQTFAASPAKMNELREELIHMAYVADTQPALEEKMDEDAARMRGRGFTLVRRFPKIGRNEPCPCGSGRKFKKCHLNRAA